MGLLRCGPKMKILKTYFKSLRKFFIESPPLKAFCWIYRFRLLNGGPLKKHTLYKYYYS